MAVWPDPAFMQAIDAIIQDVRGGKRERFREVFEQTEPMVRAVLTAMLPDRSLVEDVLHEVFVSAYQKLDDYQLGTDFGAWVKTLARNRALNERRRLSRQRSFTRRYLSEVEDRAAQAFDQLVDAVDWRMVVELRDCVERLSERPRRLVTQFYFEGRSSPEIATREKQQESGVRVALFRARAAILECLQSKGVVAHE